jgi:hypothetical protein
MARELLQNRRKTLSNGAENVTANVTTAGQSGIPGDTALTEKKGT